MDSKHRETERVRKRQTNAYKTNNMLVECGLYSNYNLQLHDNALVSAYTKIIIHQIVFQWN